MGGMLAGGGTLKRPKLGAAASMHDWVIIGTGDRWQGWTACRLSKKSVGSRRAMCSDKCSSKAGRPCAPREAAQSVGTAPIDAQCRGYSSRQALPSKQRVARTPAQYRSAVTCAGSRRKCIYSHCMRCLLCASPPRMRMCGRRRRCRQQLAPRITRAAATARRRTLRRP